jgi:hypothetical protein
MLCGRGTLSNVGSELSLVCVAGELLTSTQWLSTKRSRRRIAWPAVIARLF